MADDARDPAAFSDDQLMLRLDAGFVEDSLGELQRRYRAAVHAFVNAMVHDEHLAQDVTAEAFEVVFLKSQLYAPGSFRAWLFEIARNQALAAMRRRRRAPRPFSAFAPGEAGAAETLAGGLRAHDDRALEERELMADFHAALAALPERYQQVFRLCALQGLQYRQVARLLDVPTGTVAIRLMRARQRLFAALARHFEPILSASEANPSRTP